MNDPIIISHSNGTRARYGTWRSALRHLPDRFHVRYVPFGLYFDAYVLVEEGAVMTYRGRILTTDMMHGHIVDIATAFHIKLFLRSDIKPEEAGAGVVIIRKKDGTTVTTDQPAVTARPIVDEVSYATVLHELGHILHPSGHLMSETSKRWQLTRQPDSLRDVRLTILCEVSAWEWAERFALDWTPTMEHVRKLAMSSYVGFARRYGIIVNDKGEVNK